MSNPLGSLTATTPGADALGAASGSTLRDPVASALRARAGVDPKAALKAAAKQFEALFMQQVMKSMRDTTMSSGMFDNAGTKMGTDMLDAEFANQMTGLRGGLSQAIERQLARQMSGLGGAAAAPAAPVAAVPAVGAAGAPVAGASLTQSSFVREHQAAAAAAQAQTGIPSTFMVAQAAHESGWGRHQIRNADGSSAHNLFGIKAGPGWTGAVAEATTTEVMGGQARKVTAKFRSYPSDDAAFQDYAQLMKNSPRYAAVVAAGGSAAGFAQGLQRAGYATDPAYAAKLTSVINTTLRVQRASA